MTNKTECGGPCTVIAEQYVIYADPKDYPGKFVVRRWLVLRGDPIAAADMHQDVTETLDEARRCIPPGGVCIPRYMLDDQAIAEVWI